MTFIKHSIFRSFIIILWRLEFPQKYSTQISTLYAYRFAFGQCRSMCVYVCECKWTNYFLIYIYTIVFDFNSPKMYLGFAVYWRKVFVFVSFRFKCVCNSWFLFFYPVIKVIVCNVYEKLSRTLFFFGFCRRRHRTLCFHFGMKTACQKPTNVSTNGKKKNVENWKRRFGWWWSETETKWKTDRFECNKQGKLCTHKNKKREQQKKEKPTFIIWFLFIRLPKNENTKRMSKGDSLRKSEKELSEKENEKNVLYFLFYFLFSIFIFSTQFSLFFFSCTVNFRCRNIFRYFPISGHSVIYDIFSSLFRSYFIHLFDLIVGRRLFVFGDCYFSMSYQWQQKYGKRKIWRIMEKITLCFLSVDFLVCHCMSRNLFLFRKDQEMKRPI